MENEILNRYLSVRAVTEKICSLLHPEDTVVQTIEDVSPPKWHLAHTSWYFEMFFLKQYKKGYTLFNDKYPFLFNSYYHSMGERLSKESRGAINRPLLSQVRDYRAHTDREITEFLQQGFDSSRFPNEKERAEAKLLFEIGLNHEQQHQELMLYDIKHIFANNSLDLPYAGSYGPAPAALPDIGYHKVDEDIYKIGFRGTEKSAFYFDNEQPRHKKYIYPFQIADRLVSNGEYLDFIKDGGYENPLLWLSDGWEWLQQTAIDRPLYWMPKEDKQGHASSKNIEPQAWNEFSLAGMNPLEKNLPLCHISYYEAEAYARWAGARLAREEEWEVAAEMFGKQNRQPHHLLDMDSLHPRYSAAGKSPFAGNLWEWTNTYYLPYPGYKRDEGALGEYNGKFMSGQLVLKGGSCVTPESHYRHSYRNFFHPTKRWLFSGIRLAKDNN